MGLHKKRELLAEHPVLNVLGLDIGGEFADGVVGGGGHLLLVAVVGIDEEQEAVRVGLRHGSRTVAGGRGKSSGFVAVDGKIFNVECAAANAFVGFTGISEVEADVFARYLVGINSPHRIVRNEGDEIAEIHDGADGIEVFALHNAACQLLVGGAIATGVFARSLVCSTCGFDAGEEFDVLRSEAGAEELRLLFYFVPQRFAGSTVGNIGGDGNAAERGTEFFESGRKLDVHVVSLFMCMSPPSADVCEGAGAAGAVVVCATERLIGVEHFLEESDELVFKLAGYRAEVEHGVIFVFDVG